MRAAIRAHVTATRVATLEGQGDGIERSLKDEAVAFLDLALDCLMPRPARLVAVGGLSGSGKTTLARNLAPDLGPRPGAVVLRSDEIRKRLAGVPATQRLAQKWYRESVSRDVFRQLAETARAIVEAGHGVVADGVYGKTSQRVEIAGVAGNAGIGFRGLWLTAEADLRAAAAMLPMRRRQSPCNRKGHRRMIPPGTCSTPAMAQRSRKRQHVSYWKSDIPPEFRLRLSML
jgi:predicted kinase